VGDHKWMIVRGKEIRKDGDASSAILVCRVIASIPLSWPLKLRCQANICSWLSKPLDETILYALPRQPEVGGRRQHVAVVGPHRAFSYFLRRRKMNGVGSPYK